MITEENLNSYVIALHKVQIFQRDIKHIVYGKDENKDVIDYEPEAGDTPYLKSPEANIWFKIVQKEVI